MIKTSIIFSSRNRVKQLYISLPSMLSKYKDRGDIDIWCLDDNSPDGTKEFLDQYKDHKQMHILEYDKKNTEYNYSPGDQINFLANRCSGENLLIQSAEISHIDNVVDNLNKFCYYRNPAFANVLNCESNDSYQELFEYSSGPRDIELTFPKLILNVDHLTLNSASWGQNFSHKILLQDDYEKYLGNTSLPSYSFKDSKFVYREYTGMLRPIPLFFCGMIKREDFLGLGGYSSESPADMRFMDLMNYNKFKFTFTTTLAAHLAHDRI